MGNTKLEQKANETETKTLQETITEECHDCGGMLQIPKNILLKKNTEYKDFYISPCGIFYCNKNCFNMFTED
jgi:hypothetical protein